LKEKLYVFKFSGFDIAEIMICEIENAYPVSDWICNINFCNKVRKGDGFNPISIKKSQL